MEKELDCSPYSYQIKQYYMSGRGKILLKKNSQWFSKTFSYDMAISDDLGK